MEVHQAGETWAGLGRAVRIFKGCISHGISASTSLGTATLCGSVEGLILKTLRTFRTCLVLPYMCCAVSCGAAHSQVGTDRQEDAVCRLCVRNLRLFGRAEVDLLKQGEPQVRDLPHLALFPAAGATAAGADGC